MMNADNNALIIAKKYAKAFLHVYGADITYDQVRSVEQCSLKLASSLRVIALTKAVAQQENDHFLDPWCIKLGLPAGIKQLIKVLSNQGRVLLLADILRWVALYFYRDHGYIRALITSAVPLQEHDKEIIVRFLSEKTKGIIEAEYRVDMSLIAGIRIQSQNYIWEKSVARLLRDIKLHNVQ